MGLSMASGKDMPESPYMDTVNEICERLEYIGNQVSKSDPINIENLMLMLEHESVMTSASKPAGILGRQILGDQKCIREEAPDGAGKAILVDENNEPVLDELLYRMSIKSLKQFQPVSESPMVADFFPSPNLEQDDTKSDDSCSSDEEEQSQTSNDNDSTEQSKEKNQYFDDIDIDEQLKKYDLEMGTWRPDQVKLQAIHHRHIQNLLDKKNDDKMERRNSSSTIQLPNIHKEKKPSQNAIRRMTGGGQTETTRSRTEMERGTKKKTTGRSRENYEGRGRKKTGRIS